MKVFAVVSLQYTTTIERIICKTEVERRECIKNLEGLGYKVKPGSGWCLNNTDFNKLSLYDDNTFRASNIIGMSPGENYDDFTYKAWKKKMLNERGVLPYSELNLQELMEKFIQDAYDHGQRVTITFSPVY